MVDTLDAALQRNGQTTRTLERWYGEMPREEEMLPKDKYTIFDKKERTYRKGIHSMLFLFHWLGWEMIADSVFFLVRIAQVDTS